MAHTSCIRCHLPSHFTKRLKYDGIMSLILLQCRLTEPFGKKKKKRRKKREGERERKDRNQKKKKRGGGVRGVMTN